MVINTTILQGTENLTGTESYITLTHTDTGYSWLIHHTVPHTSHIIHTSCIIHQIQQIMSLKVTVKKCICICICIIVSLSSKCCNMLQTQCTQPWLTDFSCWLFCPVTTLDPELQIRYWHEYGSLCLGTVFFFAEVKRQVATFAKLI